MPNFYKLTFPDAPLAEDVAQKKDGAYGSIPHLCQSLHLHFAFTSYGNHKNNVGLYRVKLFFKPFLHVLSGKLHLCACTINFK